MQYTLDRNKDSVMYYNLVYAQYHNGTGYPLWVNKYKIVLTLDLGTWYTVHSTVYNVHYCVPKWSVKICTVQILIYHTSILTFILIILYIWIRNTHNTFFFDSNAPWINLLAVIQYANQFTIVTAKTENKSSVFFVEGHHCYS